MNRNSRDAMFAVMILVGLIVLLAAVAKEVGVQPDQIRLGRRSHWSL